MAAARYRQFLKLLEQWPVDKNKVGMDLGVYIRERVALGFRHGETSQIPNIDECDRNYDALQKINSNKYKNMYPRLKSGNASGCSLEECRVMTSTEAVNLLREEDGLEKMTPKDKFKR